MAHDSQLCQGPNHALSEFRTKEFYTHSRASSAMTSIQKKNKYQGTLAAGHEVAESQMEMHFTFKIHENNL